MNTENNMPKSKKTKIINIVVNTILVLVLIFGILCSYTAFVSKSGSGVPSLFGLRVFSIQSDSMETEFYEGDLIVDVKVKDPGKLKEKDVITFYTIIKGERVLNSHRITKITDNGTYLFFNTQGDNTPAEDPLGVHENEIVGKYCFRIPNMGNVIDFLQTSTGFLIVIVLPVFLFFIYNLVQFFIVFTNYSKEKMRMQIQAEMEAKNIAKTDEDADGNANADKES